MNRFLIIMAMALLFVGKAYSQKVVPIVVGPSSRVYEVVRPDGEKISIAHGLNVQFLTIPLFYGDYVCGRVALDDSMFGLELQYKSVCYNWKTGNLCLVVDGYIKNIFGDKIVVEGYHGKSGGRVIAYGCYDISLKKYLEDVLWEHYVQEDGKLFFFNGNKKNSGHQVELSSLLPKDYPDNVYLNNGVEAVDLGLSVKWASFNIGNMVTPQSNGIMISPNMEGDFAQRFWGDSWRMPTEEEFQELIEKCEWEGEQIGGTSLIKATGPSGRFVYFCTGSYMPFHATNKFNVFHIQLMWATGIVEKNVGPWHPKMLYSVRPVCDK